MHSNDPANDPDEWHDGGNEDVMAEGLRHVVAWYCHGSSSEPPRTYVTFKPSAWTELYEGTPAEARELAAAILRACDKAEEAARG